MSNLWQSIAVPIGLILIAPFWGCNDSSPAKPYISSEIRADGHQDSSDFLNDTLQDAVIPAIDVVDAPILHAAPILTECTSISPDESYHPHLFAINNRWFAFFVDGIDYAAPLNVATSSIDLLSFTEVKSLLCGAKEIDLVPDGDRLLALAARQYYAVLLESTTGDIWSELGNLAPDEPTYNCQNFPPLAFFRGVSPVRAVVMGNDFNTGVFGCTSRLFFSRRSGEEWSVPVSIGKGDAICAYEGAHHLAVLSTFGIYISTDDGATFNQIQGGETTATQLRGSGCASEGSTLYLVQDYSWANEQFLALLVSRDGGLAWGTKVILQRGQSYFMQPKVAVDGTVVVVAWPQDGSINIMASPDGGETWSATGVFGPETSSGLSNWSLAVNGNSIGVLITGNGAQMCVGAFN